MTIKEEFAKEALTLLKGTKEGVIKALDFAQDQIPQVIQEILSFTLTESIIYIIFLTLPIIPLTYLSKKVWVFFGEVIEKENKKNSYNNADSFWVGRVFLMVSLLLVSAGFFAAAFTHLITAIKITIAPRLFLIEYLTNLVK